MSLDLSPLTAISPVDGRYASRVEGLRSIFSEWGLMKRRLLVEVRWMKAMGEAAGIQEVPPLSPESLTFLDELVSNFDVQEAERVKRIESTTNHDMKAVEYYIKENVKARGPLELQDVSEFFHFACTSEDINNLSYSLMLKDAVQSEILPSLHKLLKVLGELSSLHRDAPLLALTHGQPATPTTYGKEMAVFAHRLRRQVSQLEKCEFLGKFNGATGNFNAHLVAYPSVDWEELARQFVEEGLGLTYQPMSTQIECHDFIAEICDVLSRALTVILDLCRDQWTYIQRGLLRLRTVQGEVGSSTMPHKVNPIDFENAEGNIGVSIALLKHFGAKLPVSRLQRDLTDSTVLRSIGMAVGHGLIAVDSCLKGLGKIDVDGDAMKSELSSTPEILAEPIQTVMRRFGVSEPYEKLKAFSRGRERGDRLSLDRVREFISSLKGEGKIPEESVHALMQLTPASYLGYASSLAEKYGNREGV